MTRRIIGLAISVHRCIGPGLLESVYEACLCHELVRDGLTIVRQAPLSLIYDGVRMDCRYRADVIVERSVIVEIKAVEHVVALHEAQMMTYMRLSGCRIGLLLKFSSIMLKDGLRRFVL
ncbi:MAG TPA: GxxExxY protein [Acetobacteraceae bacterium]|nr:GxxExxY protein [Acetobacteraceae bacterium]